MPAASLPSAAAGDADLAALGAVLAEPARARILLALDDGRALPASVLAVEAGVSASTTSSHLARLVAAGLLTCRPQGRYRYYALAGTEVGELIEVLARHAPAAPVRSLRDGTRAAALRTGRTCYDHLAGRLGVAVFTALLSAGDIEGGDGRHHASSADRLAARGHEVTYRLSATGRARLHGLGVDLNGHDEALHYCVDWTEQAHHLAGAAGRGLAARLLDLDWLRRAPRGRAVYVTDLGTRQLPETLGLAWPPDTA